MGLNNIGINVKSYKSIDYNSYLKPFHGIRQPRKTNMNEIEELQELIGAKLPDDYIDFLLRFNGGIGLEEEAKGGYIYKLEKIKDSSNNIEDGSFEELLGIIDDNGSGIFQVYNRCLNWLITKDFLLIGTSGIHNICLGIGNKNYGKIFFQDGEKELDETQAKDIEAGEESEYFDKYLGEDGKIDPYYNMYFIANSFEEFIRGLMTDEEYEKKYGKKF